MLHNRPGVLLSRCVDDCSLLLVLPVSLARFSFSRGKARASSQDGQWALNLLGKRLFKIHSKLCLFAFLESFKFFCFSFLLSFIKRHILGPLEPRFWLLTCSCEFEFRSWRTLDVNRNPCSGAQGRRRTSLVLGSFWPQGPPVISCQAENPSRTTDRK